MAQATGEHRHALIATRLGPEALLLERFSGREELARLFEYSVDLISDRKGIKADDLLGTNITLSLQTPKAGVLRYINGFVTSFAALGGMSTSAFKSGTGYRYHIIVHPNLWFATKRSDCRIFNNLSIPEIVKKVLAIYGGEIDDRLAGKHEVWKYCVQYRETDFNFVSRLLEQEGIYYYFLHENGRHKLVLADSPSAHEKHPQYETFEFHETSLNQVTYDDYVTEWSTVTSIQPGKFVHKDYDFFKARAVEGAVEDPGAHTFGDLEIYDYPAEGVDTSGDKSIKDRTAAYAGIRLEELRGRSQVTNGAGSVRGLEVGRRFKLAKHPDSAQNVEHLAVSAATTVTVNDFASGTGGGGADFRSSFTTQKASEPFRPQRLTPKPAVQGAQTAMVVGSGEIDTDEFGRVKVRFHWDRSGGTCWARVAQTLAGNKWGAFFIPRVGHEVVVEFLEGDPDHPIVTGVVYSGVAKPPYDLPGEKTKSTIKTNSSEGGGGFNELRFEDKKGSEQIFVHGEKQLDIRIKKDRLSWIGQDTHLIVKQDRYEKIEKDHHLAVKGDRNESVTGKYSLKVDQALEVKTGQKTAVNAGTEIHLKAGTSLIIEAGTQISLKVGGNFINIGPAGVDIQGALTKINSGGAAGSGSGSSPTTPKDPKEADDGKPGQKDAVPPDPKPPAAKTYSPQAVALKQAAASGAPFCNL